MDAETLKTQVARLKRAAKRTPLKLSAVSRAGMKEALEAVLGLVQEGKAREAALAAPPEAWSP